MLVATRSLARGSTLRVPLARALTEKASTPAPSTPAPASKPAESKPASDSKPASSESSSSSETKTSLHSSDIAFKPNSDGWGYTKSYSKGWDRIFAKDNNEAEPVRAAPAASNEDTALLTKQQAALSAAHECGALSDALFQLAKDELVAK